MQTSGVFEYALFEIAPEGWEATLGALAGPGQSALEAARGVLFGVFTPQIGIASDTGMTLAAWPDLATQEEHGGDWLVKRSGVRALQTERLVLAASPREPAPPLQPGVWAHRWFEVAPDDRDEFVQLSVEAWPDFEAAHDAHILGLFETLDRAPDVSRLLLVTRYASLAVWERSRSAQTEGERRAWGRFRRRHALTRSTLVRTTLLAPGTSSLVSGRRDEPGSSRGRGRRDAGAGRARSGTGGTRTR